MTQEVGYYLNNVLYITNISIDTSNNYCNIVPNTPQLGILWQRNQLLDNLFAISSTLTMRNKRIERTTTRETI